MSEVLTVTVATGFRLWRSEDTINKVPKEKYEPQVFILSEVKFKFYNECRSHWLKSLVYLYSSILLLSNLLC